MRILRLRELPADPAAEPALTISCAALRAEPERWGGHRGGLAVRLAPADAVEDLAADLRRLSLVEIEFPNAGEGRGYSQARLLRERLGFRGELRAVGEGVRQDRLFLLARCGFDAFELAAGEDMQAARRALARYDVAYQPGSSLLQMRRQRFHRGGSSSTLG
jgi:uncharacterized protein (DUF934 family)